MTTKRTLTQQEIDWLLEHPRLTELIDRLLGEFREARNTFDDSPIG